MRLTVKKIQMILFENKYANRSSVTSTYFSEVDRIPLLMHEEEIDLSERIKKGDESARTKLINSNLRFVITVAKHYQGYGLSLDDLINEGNIGLIKAAERFDETRGFKFTSYAVWWIRQTILYAIYEYGKAVRLPYNKIAILTKINRAIDKLMQLNERMPTIYEISEDANVSVNHITDALNGQDVSRFKSTDIVVGEGELKLSDIIPDLESDGPDRELDRSDVEYVVTKLLMQLSPRSAEVIIKRFGLYDNERMTMKEIAAEMGMVQESVRQIEKKAMRLMKARGQRIAKSVM